MMATDMLIRWIIRRDMAEVVEIDDCGYVESWSQQELIACLAARSVIGVVAEDSRRRVIGFCVYEYRDQRSEIRIIRMAVAPHERRNGVATAMITRLREITVSQPDMRITADVDGHQVFAQHLLARCGFRGAVMPDDVIRFTFKE